MNIKQRLRANIETKPEVTCSGDAMRELARDALAEIERLEGVILYTPIPAGHAFAARSARGDSMDVIRVKVGLRELAKTMQDGSYNQQLCLAAVERLEASDRDNRATLQLMRRLRHHVIHARSQMDDANELLEAVESIVD